MKHTTAGAVICALFLPALSAPADAAGFRIEGQDARAIGAALAGAQARTGDAGFAVYNPAALAGIGRFDGSATLSGLIADSGYSDASGVLLGAFPVSGSTSGEGVLADAFIPSMAFGTRLGERLVIGLTVNAPFGLKSDYGPEAALRYHAQTTELKTMAATPIAALSLTPSLSIAAGVRVQYADLSVTAASDAAGVALAAGLGSFAPGTQDVYMAFSGDDVAVGFVAGAQAQPFPGLTIGAGYTSKIDHGFNGAADFDLAGSQAGATLAGLGLFQPGGASTAFSTPALIEFGAALAVSDRLELLASASLARWRSFDSIVFDFDNAVQPDDALTHNWSDAWAFSFGAEYRADRKTALRAGVMIDDSPVDDAFATPRIPDADRLWLTAGLTRDLSERWSADVGGAVIFFDERRYALPDTLPETLFRGRLDATTDTTAYILTARLRRSY